MSDFTFEENQPLHVPLAEGLTTIEANVPAGARFSLVTPPGVQLIEPGGGSADTPHEATGFDFSGGSAARVRFSVLTLSKHYGGPVPEDINEVNPGIGVERVHSLGGNWYASYGALLYKNSFHNPGLFTQWHHFAPF